jgi:hypothetical protein
LLPSRTPNLTPAKRRGDGDESKHVRKVGTGPVLTVDFLLQHPLVKKDEIQVINFGSKKGPRSLVG